MVVISYRRIGIVHPCRFAERPIRGMREVLFTQAPEGAIIIANHCKERLM